jgi:hypothetical protein
VPLLAQTVLGGRIVLIAFCIVSLGADVDVEPAFFVEDGEKLLWGFPAIVDDLKCTISTVMCFTMR